MQFLRHHGFPFIQEPTNTSSVLRVFSTIALPIPLLSGVLPVIPCRTLKLVECCLFQLRSFPQFLALSQRIASLLTPSPIHCPSNSYPMESFLKALYSDIDVLCDLCRKQGLDDSRIAAMKEQFLRDVQVDAEKRLRSYHVVFIPRFKGRLRLRMKGWSTRWNR